MPSQISTLLFDFRVAEAPSEADIVDKVVKPIERIIETEFQKVTGKHNTKERTTAFAINHDSQLP